MDINFEHFIEHYGFWGILIGTAISEDITLFTAIALMAKGFITPETVLSAGMIGIFGIDFAIFQLGSVVRRVSDSSMKIQWLTKLKKNFNPPKSSWDVAILGARMVPGTRFPTFFSAGFSRYPGVRFALICAAAVSIWVSCLTVLGHTLGRWLSDHRILFVLGIFVGYILLRQLILFITLLATAPWSARAKLYRWRRWLSFEFWPAGFFYFPVLMYYFWLSLRYRDILTPMYSNPNILNGGFIGESKWDLYKSLTKDPAALQTRLYAAGDDQKEKINADVSGGLWNFPFVIKPDVGQRGYAVRIVKNTTELAQYLTACTFDVVVQEYCSMPKEAGVFFYRLPTEDKGKVVSITTKEFPAVVGDGKHTLSQLILKDSRARVIAETYFSRLAGHLKSVPSVGTVVPLVECGNHCQGTIFRDGQQLITNELAEKMDMLSRQIPDFYIGRFDVRYKQDDDLKTGTGIKIIEVNGAGSEMTHIWDPDYSLIQAYRDLKMQWDILFAIGALNKSRCAVKPKVRNILKLWFQMLFRAKTLSTSS